MCGPWGPGGSWVTDAWHWMDFSLRQGKQTASSWAPTSPSWSWQEGIDTFLNKLSTCSYIQVGTSGAQNLGLEKLQWF